MKAFAAFVAAVAVVFGAAFTVGTVSRPDAAADPAPRHAGMDDEPSSPANGADDSVAGLASSDRGHTISLADDRLPAGDDVPVGFVIRGTDGVPVTVYEQSHDKMLHLIAVRRDTSGFQHVHPTLGPDGGWSVPLDLTAGSWRVFADFVPGSGAPAGQRLTLGVDLEVAGDYRPLAVPAVTPIAAVDGYTVNLTGRLVPGEESELTLTVTRNGRPVTDLEPYLAAYGHLVALRMGDLAYLHVHPAGEPGDGVTASGPGITFMATAPTAGAYRLFLDFQHEGVVRTAEFTTEALAR